MAEEILKANIDEGDVLYADLNPKTEEIFIKVKKAPKSKSKKDDTEPEESAESE
jgi:hypothetical protein